MYYRIKNKFEVDLFKAQLQSQNVPPIVIDRMSEIAGTLDDYYGSNRDSGGYGGYLLFFPNCDDFCYLSSSLLEHYQINPDLFEYDDVISVSLETQWRERLYLLSSEDSLVFIYKENLSERGCDKCNGSSVA